MSTTRTTHIGMRRTRRIGVLLALVLAAALVPGPSMSWAHPLDGHGKKIDIPNGENQPASGESPISDNFELVGHDPLFSRGMNAALAMHGDYAYVGSRTDGQPQHRNPGILVVDVADPANPEVVHEIGPPAAGRVGETSRELRVWPEKDLLVVLNFGCSAAIHACAGGETADARVTFFDIGGRNAASPELVSTYKPSRIPHEFFLWQDPDNPERTLLFQSTPTSSKTRPNLVITDISRARRDRFTETRWFAKFDAGTFSNGEEEDRRLHSIGVSDNGRRTYLAFLGSGFLVLDTSQVAAGVKDPGIRLVTPPRNRVNWSNPGAHSAVKIPGEQAALVTDEVYGDALDALGPHGCPWGWVRTIDISNQTKPQVLAQHRVRENHQRYCDTAEGSDPANTTFTSYSSHNPTLTKDVAFVSWHSAGLRAIDISNPARPAPAGTFKPEPLPSVATEDPALSLGEDKVVMWSYPIVSDGLVYVVDIRNGLYVLRYTGPGAAEVADTDFLEGNSNLGSARVTSAATSAAATSGTAGTVGPADSGGSMLGVVDAMAAASLRLAAKLAA